MRRRGRPRRRTRRCGTSSRCPGASRSSTSPPASRSSANSEGRKGSSTGPTFGAAVRIAAVGDVHGYENLPAVTADLKLLGTGGLLLLAGETAAPNDLDSLGVVLRASLALVNGPVCALVRD